MAKDSAGTILERERFKLRLQNGNVIDVIKSVQIVRDLVAPIEKQSITKEDFKNLKDKSKVFEKVIRELMNFNEVETPLTRLGFTDITLKTKGEMEDIIGRKNVEKGLVLRGQADSFLNDIILKRQMGENTKKFVYLHELGHIQDLKDYFKGNEPDVKGYLNKISGFLNEDKNGLNKDILKELKSIGTYQYYRRSGYSISQIPREIIADVYGHRAYTYLKNGEEGLKKYELSVKEKAPLTSDVLFNKIKIQN